MSTALLEAAREMERPLIPVMHVIKGKLVTGTDVEFRQASGIRFATPKLDMNTLVWPRRETGPAFNMPIDQIIDFLVELGAEIGRDKQGLMAEALENMSKTCTLERRIVENCYRDIAGMFSRASMEYQIEMELGGKDVLDGWRDTMRPNGRAARIRAYPPRLVHIMAGNTPAVAAGTIIQASLTKGVHLLKMPSNDLFTAPAILRIMAGMDPEHPLVKSFSAVYWRGGDSSVESHLCRPQFFDKLVAWGGESAILGIKQYAGPGFELITFDPKTSISLIGHEIFESDAALEEAAELAAQDATPFNQGACTSSRFQFIEGTVEQVDKYCEVLQRNLGKERHTTSAISWRVPADLREEVEGLRGLEPDYRIFGGYEGKGLVIRSDDPVDFYPDGKMVNVVRVEKLTDAVQYATVATQTVGVYPYHRKLEVRDLMPAMGVQRVVNLGQSMGRGLGMPHDGFWAYNRYMRWITDEE